MTASTSAPTRRAAGHPLKSPLALAGDYSHADVGGEAEASPGGRRTAVTDRGVTLAEGLNRYAELKGRPKTLGAEFVGDLLEVTGGGKARDFLGARDHAIIRILRSEGIRRAEILGMVMHSLPADVIKNRLIRLVPLKGARAAGEGRCISLAPASARALAVYLRARRRHKLADSDWVWLGTGNRGRLRETGLRLVLVRRAERIIAGYAPDAPRWSVISVS
jgi:site-specific recombinase XerC